MISRAQQILLKRAQAEASIEDAEYRALLGSVTGLPGCRSSKDSRLSDAHLDHALALFEEIHWRAVDAGGLQPSCKANAVFRNRGYWAAKNLRASTSRDRFAAVQLTAEVAELEERLIGLGCGASYLAAILDRSGRGAGYLQALRRTLRSKHQAA